MLPITSLKCVNTTLKPTLTAQLCAAGLLAVCIWAVAISAIPLVASWVILIPLCYLVCTHTLFPRSLHGNITLKSDRQMVVRQNNTCVNYYRVASVQLALSEWLLVVEFYGVGRCLVWRQSMTDREYRQWIRWLRQGQERLSQHEQLS
ncbi:hypothetical protein ACPV5R_07520 [Vibrio astriarenae]